EQVGSTTADENGNFTFTVPDGLVLGQHEVSAIAVDEAGNRSDASSPTAFGVLAARADAGPSDQLADTGGPQGWLPVAGVLGLLAGGGILAVTRWRRRSS
ncbi:MAG TPA: Ig-like domain-containing protein, partial [Propionibacteriaceae bacterium]|nr:Ig-like domain-containing protein [Propionibacteriaceae bacterium]